MNDSRLDNEGVKRGANRQKTARRDSGIDRRRLCAAGRAAESGHNASFDEYNAPLLI